MAINASNAGVVKPVLKANGIIYYADANTIDIEDITASVDLSTLGFTDAGAISTDGVTVASNATEPEQYMDFNNNIIDSGEASNAPTITFTLLEVLSKNAASLVYSDSSITDGVGDQWTEITGTENPSNKMLVIDTRIKNNLVRYIFEEVSFSSRGDTSFTNDSLFGWEVTYAVLAGATGTSEKRLLSKIE